jgi:hypothetical protein
MMHMHRLLLAVSLGSASGCWGSADVPETQVGPVDPPVRTVPEWSEADMQVWHFAKERGVHGTDLAKRTIGPYELMHIRELPETTPPIHAGPPAIPKIWVVRADDALFTTTDAQMADVLMTDDAMSLAELLAADLHWMGADEIHALVQTRDNGVTTLSWIHSRGSYPPSRSSHWEKVVVTATSEGTTTEREPLKDYVRKEADPPAVPTGPVVPIQ